MAIRKRQQVLVLNIRSNKVQFIENTPFIKVGWEDFVLMSENYVFRAKGNSQPVTIEKDGFPREYQLAHFAVFKNMVDPEKDITAQEVLAKGLVVQMPTGEYIQFARVLRSASQYRTAKFLMTHLDKVERVREQATYGWIRRFEGKMVNVNKVEPYASLSLTSSLSAGRGYTSINIDDYVSKVDITGALCVIDDKVAKYDEYLIANGSTKVSVVEGRSYAEFELTDGQFLISPFAGARQAFRIGQINVREYKMLRAAFKDGIDFKSQLITEDLMQVWAKISRGTQNRFAIKKGFGIIFDHPYYDENGRQYDLVFPSGAVKGNVEDHGVKTSSIELCTAAVAPVEKKDWAKMNYQFIQSLDLTFDTLKVLTSIACNKIVQALESPEKAMQFIGMVISGDEADFEEDNLSRKLRRLLAANPKIFYTRWIQKQIKSLMEKTIMDMRMGRIPVETSKFVYIVSDPSVLCGDLPLLQSGEFYFNGEVGERAIFRSPLIDRSEATVINCVTSPELEAAFGHIKNVLIMNVFDDKLPRMGGADTDGDKVLMTANQMIIDAVDRTLPMIYGDTTKKDKPKEYAWHKNGFNAIFETDLKTLNQSQIGVVTNYCTTLVDMARDARFTPQQQEYCWNMVIRGRVTQGQIIDDAKRGTTTTIAPDLKQAVFPHWLRDREAAKLTAEDKDVYHSQSPMGKLYDYVTTRIKERLDQYFSNLKPYAVNLLSDITFNVQETNDILEHISTLEGRYRNDMADFMSEHGMIEPAMYENKEDYDQAVDIRDAALQELIVRHQTILASTDASAISIGVACLHVAEYSEGRGGGKANSYPYVIGTEYLVAVLKNVGDNFKMVRVSNVDDWYWESSLVNRRGNLYNSEGAIAGRVRYDLEEDQAYETFEHDGDYFVKVPVASEEVDVEAVVEKQVQFNVKAFGQYGTNAKEVMQLISARTLQVEMFSAENGEWMAIVLDGRRLATIGKESQITMSQIKNKKLEVIAISEYKGVLKIDAKVIGDAIRTVIEEQPVTQLHHIQPNYDDIYADDMVFDTLVGL